MATEYDKSMYIHSIYMYIMSLNCHVLRIIIGRSAPQLGSNPVTMFVLTVTIMPELNECVYGKILEVDGGGFPACQGCQPLPKSGLGTCQVWRIVDKTRINGSWNDYRNGRNGVV